MRVFTNYKQLRAALDRPAHYKRAWRFNSGKPAAFVCHDCKQIVPFPMAHVGTGYSLDQADNMRCYDCCGARERENMVNTGKATLYLSRDTSWQRPTVGSDSVTDRAWIITDWPGKLRFRPWTVRKGWHNMAGNRYDTWFAGPDGHVWHGVQYGDNTQILHCKRTKERY